eukprot:103709_1
MTSPKKRGEGTSCHHCKKRIRPNEMLKCTRGEIVPTNSRKRKRPCVKKYCLHCIKTFYNNQYLDDNNSGSFICPACRDECRCAACRRRVMKARLKNDGSALENEADHQSNSILESQTPDATNIEEGQVNGLLEILDSRPDVQDIIRRGMAMDFADDNAKILYVGHLIDQALTRPDVLALYYASSHGRANNCRIKTETASNHNDLPPQTHIIDLNHENINTKRKKRNHRHSSIQSSGHESPKRRRKKKKHNSNSNIRGVSSIKTEPVMVNNNLPGAVPVPATISLSGGNLMNFGSFPPPITMNGISQPHLGGNNGIHSHGHGHGHGHGPPPNLPPINIPFPIDNRNNNNNGKNIPAIPLNIGNIHNDNDVPPPP